MSVYQHLEASRQLYQPGRDGPFGPFNFLLRATKPSPYHSIAKFIFDVWRKLSQYVEYFALLTNHFGLVDMTEE